jgi:glycogen operon protein
VLRRSRFLTGLPNDEGIKDVAWINATGVEMQDEHWTDARMHCFGMLLDGRAQATGIRKPGEDTSLLLVLNAHDDVVEFVLPESTGGSEWTLLLDTNLADLEENVTFPAGKAYIVTGRSLLLFKLAGS